MTWQKISSTIKYQNRYMTVTEDVFVTDKGEKGTFGIVRKEPFSIVIPWDGTKLLLVGQYRHSVEIFSWEFPMGHAEADDPVTAAKRELQEETGLITTDLIELATFYPAIGTMDQKGFIYLTQHWEKGAQNLDPAEAGMQLRWVTVPELEGLIADGTIFDGPTITAYYYFQQFLRQ